ncbi:hypothetical protein L9F63_010898 [Diploptera punctata]|uniref:Cyclic nucleotide-binding domain-containing protein n=1 Tax=Diploptera punctata TaxID=6984 RepID=A0AAD8EQ26_DIPPU|nr:hypothetical protein L9F63_010898 [Diploptera punctata]
MPYQDESGEIITTRRQIIRRYVRSPTGLWLNLVSASPLDSLLLIFIRVKQRWIWASYLRCIQVFRIVFIFKYFNLKYERLNVNMVLQKMSSTITYFALFTHTAACIWFLIGKYDPDKNTWVYQNNKTDAKRVYTYVFQYNSPYILSIYYICSLMSTVGPMAIPLTTLPELLFTIIIMLFVKPITALFIGEVSATIASSTYTLVNKDYDTSILKIYMQNDRVSPPLISKVINYVKMLWVLGRGTQFPDFLKTAPRYLSEEFKVTAYGMHVIKAPVFKGCDSDFLRQVITYLKRFTFFPGNFIAYKGEVNNRMYFIHQGSIEVVTMEGSIEYLHEILYERDIFGVTQGLENGKPHQYTYKAVTVVIILALKFTDWQHLCAFFPKSREKIFRQLANLNL